MIEFENVKKSFDGKAVLHGINGVFEPGRTNLIIGTSGTGKSVLLKCMVGLIEPDEGSVDDLDAHAARGPGDDLDARRGWEHFVKQRSHSFRNLVQVHVLPFLFVWFQ